MKNKESKEFEKGNNFQTMLRYQNAHVISAAFCVLGPGLGDRSAPIKMGVQVLKPKKGGKHKKPRAGKHAKKQGQKRSFRMAPAIVPACLSPLQLGRLWAGGSGCS